MNTFGDKLLTKDTDEGDSKVDNHGNKISAKDKQNEIEMQVPLFNKEGV